MRNTLKNERFKESSAASGGGFMEALLINRLLFCEFPTVDGWVNSFDNDHREVIIGTKKCVV